MLKIEQKFLEKCKGYQASCTRDAPDSPYIIIDAGGVYTNAWYICRKLLSTTLDVNRTDINMRNVDDFIPSTIYDMGVAIIKQKIQPIAI